MKDINIKNGSGLFLSFDFLLSVYGPVSYVVTALKSMLYIKALIASSKSIHLPHLARCPRSPTSASRRLDHDLISWEEVHGELAGHLLDAAVGSDDCDPPRLAALSTLKAPWAPPEAVGKHREPAGLEDLEGPHDSVASPVEARAAASFSDPVRREEERIGPLGHLYRRVEGVGHVDVDA
jgi:hypothetical protein